MPASAGPLSSKTGVNQGLAGGSYPESFYFMYRWISVEIVRSISDVGETNLGTVEGRNLINGIEEFLASRLTN